MTITIEKRMGETSFELEVNPRLQLIEEVRRTKTLDGEIPLYKDAKISIETFSPNDLYPTAKYVLTANLKFVSAMRDELLNSDGVDILDLDRIWANHTYIVAPPVVEMSDGVPAIVDGLHRCFLARHLGKRISVIFVNGVDPNYPIISTPVSWNEVVEYQTKPEIAHLLRNVRLGIHDESGSLRKYYRDFSYLGSIGRRPRQGQIG